MEQLTLTPGTAPPSFELRNQAFPPDPNPKLAGPHEPNCPQPSSATGLYDLFRTRNQSPLPPTERYSSIRPSTHTHIKWQPGSSSPRRPVPSRAPASSPSAASTQPRGPSPTASSLSRCPLGNLSARSVEGKLEHPSSYLAPPCHLLGTPCGRLPAVPHLRYGAELTWIGCAPLRKIGSSVSSSAARSQARASTDTSCKSTRLATTS